MDTFGGGGRAVRVYTRAYASFRVFGPALDPLEVTLALQLPPDHTHRTGEPRLRRNRGGAVRELSPYRDWHWSMSSEAWVQSPRLAVHLDWLLGQLEPRAKALAGFRREGVRMDFFCYSLGTVSSPPPLPRSIHSRASALGVSVEIDHYCVAEGPDAAPGTSERVGE
jgi:hypothetical protein